MELKSMKMSADQAKEDSYAMPVGGDLGDAPRYFYGLRIDLCDEALKAMSIIKMPAAGDTLMIQARVRVDTVSETAQQDGVERCMCLQITDLGLGPDTMKPSAEERLYNSTQDPD